MDKRSVSTEWIDCESDAAWDAAHTPDSAPNIESARAPRVRALRIWATAAVALLLLFVTGVWVWRTAQAGLAQIDAELNDAVAQQLWAIKEGKSELAVSLATSSSDQVLRKHLQQEYALLLEAAPERVPADKMIAEVEIVRLEKEMAVVRVLIEIGEESFRQTRLYRQTSEGWLQILAEPALLGERRLLETEHLSIGYFELDAAAVADAARKLDAFVVQARADFGLPLSVGEDRFMIEILPDILPDINVSRHYLETDKPYRRSAAKITSPSLQLLPTVMSDSDAIVQVATREMVYRYLEEAKDRHSDQWRITAHRWLPLQFAFRLWEFWESDAPLAAWKKDIVTWVYTYPNDFPTHYERICHEYRMWELSPLSMSIPLMCESGKYEGYEIYRMPDRLGSLLAPEMDCCGWETIPPIFEFQVVGLATMLDFAVVTYGRERLPVLIGALGEHEGWETLIPAVFGVSAAEFEQGWQQYMGVMYGSR